MQTDIDKSVDNALCVEARDMLRKGRRLTQAHYAAIRNSVDIPEQNKKEMIDAHVALLVRDFKTGKKLTPWDRTMLPTEANFKTKAELARIWEVSAAAVGQMFAKAGAPEFVDGKIDFEIADAYRTGSKRMDKANPPPDYMEARARLTDEQAREAKRENDVEEGKLHLNDDCDRARAEEAQIIRAELLNLGNKLAPELGETAGQQRRCKVILDRWADETLTGWSAWANGKRGKV